MSAPFVRPRSASEVIDAAFQIFRLHYAEFVAATAAFILPVMVVRLLLPERYKPIAALVSQLMQPVATGAVILIAADAYLGRETNLRRSVREAARRMWRLVLVWLAQGLVIGFGLILLIVPGFIFFAWSSAMPVVVMLEPGTGVNSSWLRSKALVKGEVGRVLLTFGLTIILFLLLLIALSAAVGGLMGAFGASGAAYEDALLDLLTILTYPAVGIVGTVLYYDLRIRKEGFDLDLMAEQLGVAGDGPDVPTTAGPVR